MFCSRIEDPQLSEGCPSLRDQPIISADINALGASSSPVSLPSSPDESCARSAPSLHHALAPLSLIPHSTTTTTHPLDTDSIAHTVRPLPEPPARSSSAPQLPSPLVEDSSDLVSLNFAASALPPTNVSLPTPPIVKIAHNLRLPSFDELGIANPHPDRIAASHLTAALPSLGAGSLSKPEDPLHALSPPLAKPQRCSGLGEPLPGSSASSKPQAERSISLVTPPAEPGTVTWGAFVNVCPSGFGSPPHSTSAVSPKLDSLAGSAVAALASADPLSVADLSDALGMAAWIETVKSIIISNLHPPQSDSVKVLSHALPCPSVTGHLFGQIIARIHDRSTAQTSWINVFHALPGRYTLFDLPKSPPSTPGPPVEGDEYFTSKVFDSAVPVVDYQLDSKLLPPSPRPVVPPGSVNVSIVERYIPPTNDNEFAEMFKLNGSSLLYDRLIELSSNDGLLLFIYPTRRGARIFMRDYLGPVLDPLLRTVTVVHDLSSGLGRNLGGMAAVERLADYETLHAEMERFLEKISQGPTNLNALPEQRSTYTLIHAAREELILDRAAWASDWWVKQEKSRVRDLVTKYFRKKLPSSELTSNGLIQEILEGVAHRESTGARPDGVEIGVFIIKKSACA